MIQNILVGFGFVGKAVYASMIDPHSDCTIVDPRRGTTMGDPVIKQRYASVSQSGLQYPTIIICVGTPSSKDGACDIGAFAQVWEEVKDYDNSLIIIKSTLPKEMIPNKPNVVYNPEFLQANTAIEDFKNQDYIILGGELDWTLKAERWYKHNIKLKDNVEFEHCTTAEASDFKYLRNIYNAYDLMFWEYVQDMTGNARKMADMMENLPIGSLSTVGMDGYRGFGGACLPKDTKAYHEVNEHKLTEFLLSYNKDLNDF